MTKQQTHSFTPRPTKTKQRYVNRRVLASPAPRSVSVPKASYASLPRTSQSKVPTDSVMADNQQVAREETKSAVPDIQIA